MLGNQLLTLTKNSTVYVANKPKRWYQGQVNILVYCVQGKCKWWWILHVSNLKKVHLSISFLEIFFGDSWARILSLFFNFKSFMLNVTIWFLYKQKVITITSLVATYHHTVDPLHHMSTSSALAPLASCNHQLFTVSMRVFVCLFVCLFVLPCLLICFFFCLLMWVKSYGICLSSLDLFHSALYCQGPSMLSQMSELNSILWSSILYIYTCMCVCVYIYIYIYIYICMYVCIYHIFPIHSVIDWHLGCFHILANINNATRKISVSISFWITVFLYFG